MPFNANFSGRRGAPKAPKSGSRSPKHRGYRPEEPTGKNRWNADERAARRDDRDGASNDRGTRRPDWTPPENRPQRPGKAAGQQRRARAEQNARTQGGRPTRDDRGGRDFSGRNDRGYTPRDARGGRPERDERGRGERGGYQPRDDRGGARQRDDRGYGRREDRGYAPREDRGFDRRDDRGAARQRDERGSARRDDRGYSPREDRGFDRRDDRGDRRDNRGGSRRDDRGYAPRDDRGSARRDDRAQAPREARESRAPRTDGAFREDRQARDRSRERAESRAENTGRFDRYAPAARADRPRIDRMGDVDRSQRRSEFYAPRVGGHVEDVVLERLEATATTAEEVDGVTFGDLGLGTNIVRTLGELGAEQPFPIQAATIPDVLAGRNVLGRGRTGSGKTIAFGAPLVERLMENGGGTKRALGRAPRALILAPTRELALQIDRTIQPIARSVGLFTTQVYGGVPQARQVGGLKRGVDIVIGTPGRIEDLEAQGHLDLSQVSVVVLDEADHMCDLGFLEPVQRILRMTRPDGQRLLFSATLDTGVATLVDEFLPEPSVHEVAGEDQASSTIDHRLLIIDPKQKVDIIAELAAAPGKTLIFARTRSFAEQLAEELADRGVPTTSLHGDLNQARRTRSLERLTSGKVDVLVATDVAARGIHVDDIEMVIQADAPEEYKTYLHRAGRTGRAGKHGVVVTLIGRNRRRKMEELLDRAEIEAQTEQAAPGDAVIRELAAR